MAEVATLTEENTTPEFVVPCPKCGSEVRTPQGRGTRCRARCSTCRHRFRPDRMRTQVRSLRPSASDPSDPLVGTTLGGYELIRLIGRGGMGRVYEGLGADGQRAALKVMDEGLAGDAAFRRRFHREARLLGALSHPHIVPVLAQGEAEGRLWFVMDYVRGESLRHLMARGPLDTGQAIRIAGQIADALGYAHAKQIVHRDLKPENVLLDEQGNVHLVDFGLSRLMNTPGLEATTRLTRTDVIMGTYEYMAPEQRRGDRTIDGRSDLFGLGVMLYEMLTGSLPLGRFALPSELRKDVSPALDTVIGRALAMRREDRYGSVAAFQTALDDAARRKKPQTDRAQHPKAIHVDDVADARGVLRHIDLLAGLDRAAGILLLLTAFGGGIAANVLGIEAFATVRRLGFVALVVSGALLLSLGRRLRNLEQGSREAQITASVIMLIVPPWFLTPFGLYGLWALTSPRARRAFALGPKLLRASSAAEIAPTRIVELPTAQRPKPAHFLLRVVHFLTVIWSLYAAFVGIELLSSRAHKLTADFIVHAEMLRNVSIFAAGLSVLLLLHLGSIRERRRGLALGAIMFAFLLGASLLLVFGLEEAHTTAPHLFTSWLVGTAPQVPAAAPFLDLPPLLEIVR